MTLDRFGEEVHTGDVVVYADTNVSGNSISLDVYLVTQLIDVHTCKGQLMNGEWAGEEFYLENTTSRCAFLYESSPEMDEDEEEEDSLPEQPTLN
jgi:hypothetical protein